MGRQYTKWQSEDLTLVQRLEEQLLECQEALAQAEQNARHHKECADEALAREDSLLQEREDLRLEIEETKQQLQSEMEKTESTRGILEQVKHEINKVHHNLIKERDIREQLESELAERTNELNQRNKALDEVENLLRRTGHDLKSKDSTIAELNQRIDEMTIELSNKNQLLGELEERLSILDEATPLLRKELEDKSNALMKAKDKVQKLELETNRLRHAVEEFPQRYIEFYPSTSD